MGYPASDNDVTIAKMMSSSNLFDVDVCFFFFFVKFSYWSKFLVNIITGSGVMIVFVYEGLTSILEIGNPPSWVLPNICRLGRIRAYKFGTNVSNKKLLNIAKCLVFLQFFFQNYNFCRFWVIKEKTTPVKITPHHPD